MKFRCYPGMCWYCSLRLYLLMAYVAWEMMLWLAQQIVSAQRTLAHG